MRDWYFRDSLASQKLINLGCGMNVSHAGFAQIITTAFLFGSVKSNQLLNVHSIKIKLSKW